MKTTHNLAIHLLKLLSRSWRIAITGSNPKAPAIIVFWHGDMLPVWKYFAGKNSRAVVSQSNDGTFLSTLLESWGYTVFRGSSSRGGKEVLDRMVEDAPKGFLLITPDGPKGPIYKFKPGAVIASHRSAVPIVFCSVNIRSYKTFEKSWDRFRLPLPFTKIELAFSEPFHVPSESSREEINNYIAYCENCLTPVCDQDKTISDGNNGLRVGNC